MPRAGREAPRKQPPARAGRGLGLVARKPRRGPGRRVQEGARLGGQEAALQVWDEGARGSASRRGRGSGG